MKKRRTVVVAFLLVAVLVIGVGYANLTDLLTISGNMEASSVAAQTGFDEKVYFSAAEWEVSILDPNGTGAATQATGVEDITVSSDKDEIDLRVTSFATAGQKVVLQATIQNDNQDLAAAITLKANAGTHTTDDNYTVTYAFSDTDSYDAAIADSITIQPNAFAYVFVTITLDKTPEPDADGNPTTLISDFTIDLDVTSATPTT